MDKYVLYVESAYGFCGYLQGVTFDSPKEYRGWIHSNDFVEFANDVRPTFIAFRNQVTLDTSFWYNVRLNEETNKWVLSRAITMYTVKATPDRL